MAVALLYRGRDSTERAAPPLPTTLSLPCRPASPRREVCHSSSFRYYPLLLLLFPPPLPCPVREPSFHGRKQKLHAPGTPHNEFLFIARCHAVLERGCRSERGFGGEWGEGSGGSAVESSAEMGRFVRDNDTWTKYAVASVEGIKEGRKEGRKEEILKGQISDGFPFFFFFSFFRETNRRWFYFI